MTKTADEQDALALEGRITTEDIDRCRRQIGVPQYERNPVFNRVATSDTMSHYAFGIGDDNPLWHDPQYGRTTRWRDQIAFPLYVQSTGIDETPKPTPELKELFRGLFRNVGKYFSGGTWTIYRPVYPGDVIYRQYTTLDVQVKENSKFTGGMTVIDTYRYFYVNKLGEPVATYDLSYVNAERRATREKGKNKDIGRATYTREDIERIDAMYAAEECRGGAKRYFEDVNVGDQLTPVVKGPFAIRDVIGFHIGWGFGQMYNAGPLRYAWKQRTKMPAFFSTDEYGVPDVMQRLHWEQGRAVELGLPAPYDYGTMRTHWLAHLVTNWMGDDAWLWRLESQARAFNFVGDTTVCSGEVIGKRVEDGQHLVDLKVQCTNQRGETTSPGSATVVLPSRANGAVLLPAAPAALRQRGANMMSEAAERSRSGSSG
ncbi:MAG: MaoC family dehydratase N-terminal domain-containing protein [Gammaproteobacteria bacterium]